MTAAAPRLSLEPLIGRYGGVSGLARALGRERAQVSKWRSRGLPATTADVVAVALGLHPVEVWPDWYDVFHFEDAAA